MNLVFSFHLFFPLSFVPFGINSEVLPYYYLTQGLQSINSSQAYILGSGLTAGSLGCSPSSISLRGTLGGREVRPSGREVEGQVRPGCVVI